VQNSHWKVGTIVLATIAMSWLTACGPAALEEKRLADQCNAVHGFNTPEARGCQNVGVDYLAMRDH
jgi:hypothetical protein